LHEVHGHLTLIHAHFLLPGEELLFHLDLLRLKFLLRRLQGLIAFQDLLDVSILITVVLFHAYQELFVLLYGLLLFLYSF
jgi:hypothetical protein